MKEQTLGQMIAELEAGVSANRQAIAEIEKFKLILANTPDENKKGTMEEFMRKHGMNPDLLFK